MRNTIEISAITNHKIDPHEVDLRETGDEFVEELKEAMQPSGSIQKVLVDPSSDPKHVERIRQDIKDARDA